MEKPSEKELYLKCLWENSPATQRQRMSQYKRLRLFKDVDLELWTIDDAFKFLMTKKSVNTQYNFVAIFLRFHPDWREELQPYVDELISERSKCAVARNRDQLEWLPRKVDLDNHEDMLFDQGKWKEFIISYLLTHVYCRSQDIQAWVKDEHQALGYENYLVRYPSYVEFIRNKYKTVKTYGPKRCIIHDSRFQHALRQLNANDRIAHSNAEIRAATYKNIGEGSYFKICTLDTCENGRNVLNIINHMSKSRGTDFSTMVLNYNLQN